MVFYKRNNGFNKKKNVLTVRTSKITITDYFFLYIFIGYIRLNRTNLNHKKLAKNCKNLKMIKY